MTKINAKDWHDATVIAALIKAVRRTAECPECHTYLDDMTTIYHHDFGCLLARVLSVPEKKTAIQHILMGGESLETGWK
jgi:hypothetical protein